MSQTPDPQKKDIVKWLGLALLIFGPPTGIIAFAHSITTNPYLIAAIIIGYEIALFIIGLTQKVWGQLEGPFIDYIAERVKLKAWEWHSAYYRHYCQYFVYEHRDLDVKGLSTQGTFTLDLEQVFVDLQIDPTPAHKASANPLPLPVELRSGSHSIWEYLMAPSLHDQHLVLLGAPGSGKTTLLKHIGLSLLHHNVPRYAQHLSHRLPILLFLREHSQAIKENPKYSLANAIRNQTSRWQYPMPDGWIERKLSKGQCIILFDGLDEVADPTTRLQTVEWVHQQTIAHGTNRFIITSRPFGYRNNPLSRVTILEVQAFSFEQVTQFTQNWYLANEIKSAVRNDPGVHMKAQNAANDLLHRLRKSPSLSALAVNPLLLTMIATVHRYRGSLPGARITLYKEICEVLLGKRQEARGILQDLRADQRQLVLQPLAYVMMQQGIREITSTQAEIIITEALQHVTIAATPKAFLQTIENGSGLLLERENDVYTFAHLTFQEYLAAAHIQKNNLEAILANQVEASWWHETIRLYCAQADATSIIATCIEKSVHSVTALTLALECEQEAQSIQAPVKQQLRKIIEEGIEAPNPERRRITTEALLSHRLRQMHPIDDNTYIDKSLVTCAEYQLFLDEQQAQQKYYQPDHWADFSFKTGDGNTPVLGVRQADAQAFCVWLTARDTEQRQYRLPQREETKDIQLSNPETGYWMMQGFAWSQKEPSSLLRQQFIEHIDHAITHDFVRAHDRAHDLDFDLDFDLDLDRALTLAHALNLDLTLVRARARARALTLALDLDFDRALDFVRALAFTHDFDRGRALALDFAHARLRALDRARARARVLVLDFDRAHDRVLDFDRALDIYSTLVLLQERIVGRFPAYEGILLVKERAVLNPPKP